MTHRAQQSTAFSRAPPQRASTSARERWRPRRRRARARLHAHDPRTSRLGARAHVPRGLAARDPRAKRDVSPEASLRALLPTTRPRATSTPPARPRAASPRLSRVVSAPRLPSAPLSAPPASPPASRARRRSASAWLTDPPTFSSTSSPWTTPSAPSNDQHSPTVTDDVAREDDTCPIVHFANVEVLARHYGLPPAGSSPSADDDRACLARLAVAHGRHGAARAPLLATRRQDVDVLSSLLVGDDEYVQRFRVCDPETGEVSILTLRMALDERLMPDYKSAGRRATLDRPLRRRRIRIAGRRSRRRDGSDVRAKTSPAGSTLAGDGGGRADRRARRGTTRRRRFFESSRRRRVQLRARRWMRDDSRRSWTRTRAMDVLRSAQLSRMRARASFERRRARRGRRAPRSSSCWAETLGAWGVDATAAPGSRGGGCGGGNPGGGVRRGVKAEARRNAF